MNFRKIIKSVFVLLVLIILVGIYVLSQRINNSTYKLKEDEERTSVFEEFHNNEYFYDELIQTVIKRNIDWNTLPLTDNFKNKFKKDIFNIRLKNDYVYYLAYPPDRNKQKQIVSIDTIENSGERWLRKIHYICNEKYELDDMELIDEKLLVDSQGEGYRYDTWYNFSDSSYERIMITRFLFMPFKKSRYDKFNTTKHFKEKFPEVERNEPIKIDRKYLFLGFIDEINDEFLVCLYDETSHYEYKIKIITDDTGAVDDMIYKYIKTYNGDINNIEIYNGLVEEAMSNEW